MNWSLFRLGGVKMELKCNIYYTWSLGWPLHPLKSKEGSRGFYITYSNKIKTSYCIDCYGTHEITQSKLRPNSKFFNACFWNSHKHLFHYIFAIFSLTVDGVLRNNPEYVKKLTCNIDSLVVLRPVTTKLVSSGWYVM